MQQLGLGFKPLRHYLGPGGLGLAQGDRTIGGYHKARQRPNLTKVHKSTITELFNTSI